MSGLIGEVLAAHGGLERWQSVSTLTAQGRFGGLLSSRFPGNRMANVTVRVQVAEQNVVLLDFPHAGRRAVFDRGEVRIETAEGDIVASRRDARAAFSGVSGLRRNVRWDALDVAYFAGYAWWNYLTTPFLLTRDGVNVSEGDSWSDGGEQWRRLEVSFPPGIHTHSRHQIFHVDSVGLIRRHDYVAEPVGRWARAAHFCSNHRQVAGLVFPMRRRVQPRVIGGRTLRRPTLVALDIDEIEVES